jgi:cytochrome P450
MSSALPFSDVDLWSDEVLSDPYPVWRELRDLGPIVFLPRYDLYAVTRYDDVKTVLQDWQTFSSAQGVAFNAPLNEGLTGSLIGSDPPMHARYRKILERPLAPRELKPIHARIKVIVEEIVGNLAGRATVEAVSELASPIPLRLVRDLIGLPEEGQERMLEWAASGFNALAPMGTARVAQGFEAMDEWTRVFREPTFLERVHPDSWASRLRDAADAGEITRDEALTFLQMNYTFAALDTTIHSTSNLLWLLATHPEAWAALKANPALVGRAVNEALRIEGPVQAFSRVLTCDALIGGAELAAGRRILVSYASANRDERHYPEPDRFDIQRNAADHLAFGYREHLCLGRNLATLEMTLLLSELVDKVESLSVEHARRDINNVLRGFAELHLTYELTEASAPSAFEQLERSPL